MLPIPVNHEVFQAYVANFGRALTAPYGAGVQHRPTVRAPPHDARLHSAFVAEKAASSSLAHWMLRASPCATTLQAP